MDTDKNALRWGWVLTVDKAELRLHREFLQLLAPPRDPGGASGGYLRIQTSHKLVILFTFLMAAQLPKRGI